MKKSAKVLMLAVALFTMSFTSAYAAGKKSPGTAAGPVTPLANAHAHNDYEHTRPLLDALAHGFTSVEADVWLKDGELLVAHDEIDTLPEKTLKTLYLDPLKERFESKGKSVYPGYNNEFILWIDIKSEGEATYKEIHEQLRDYQKMLTKFLPSGMKQGAVTVYISGNRPRATMEQQPVRYAAFDGRMDDLGTNVSPDFMPVISDNWTKHFTWMGMGEMPANEREKLNTIVKTAHSNGQKVRFWATPDTPSPARNALWTELLNAGVDLINTDDLSGLEKFLKETASREN